MSLPQTTCQHGQISKVPKFLVLYITRLSSSIRYVYYVTISIFYVYYVTISISIYRQLYLFFLKTLKLLIIISLFLLCPISPISSDFMICITFTHLPLVHGSLCGSAVLYYLDCITANKMPTLHNGTPYSLRTVERLFVKHFSILLHCYAYDKCPHPP